LLDKKCTKEILHGPKTGAQVQSPRDESTAAADTVDRIVGSERVAERICSWAAFTVNNSSHAEYLIDALPISSNSVIF
jgi:hypothetical protein